MSTTVGCRNMETFGKLGRDSRTRRGEYECGIRTRKLADTPLGRVCEARNWRRSATSPVCPNRRISGTSSVFPNPATFGDLGRDSRTRKAEHGRAMSTKKFANTPSRRVREARNRKISATSPVFPNPVKFENPAHDSRTRNAKHDSCISPKKFTKCRPTLCI